jgi:hypothetical protein
MLRQILILVFPLLLLVGCTASSRLQSTQGNKYQYSISMFAPEKSKDMLFRDDQLIIQFRLSNPGIRFQIQNISPTDMRIDWANASIGIHKAYSPVRNISTIYDATAKIPSGQLIPPLGVIRDAILPRGNTYFDGVQWRVDDLLPTTDANERAIMSTIMRQVGGSIDVILPLEFGSDVRTYQFTFSVDSVRQVAWSDYRPASWLPPQPPVRRLQQGVEDWVTAAILATGFLVILRYVTVAKKTPVVE